MKAYRHLVKHALSKGLVVSVWDGEVWEVQRSNKLKEITGCIESVEEAELKVRDADGKLVGWALVSAYGLADDEMVIDWSDNEWMNEWFEAFEETLK
jgi:hypothetical protein